MKHFLLLAFLPFLGFGQDTLWDDFSDGNFSQNPIWQGDDSLFTVNTNNELQLNANNSGHSFLATKSKISQKAQWRFKVKLGFNPSSSNYLKVYLCSDKKDLNGLVNGYFVRVGGSSQDKLSLYKQTGNSIQLLTESPASYLNNSNIELNVSVLRDSNSLWSLSADTGSVVNPLVLFGSSVDSSFSSSAYFGFSCKYTSTRSKLFFFDDVNVIGFPYKDQQNPKLDTILQVNKNTIKLVFNEAVTKTSVENNAVFLINKGFGNPVFVKLDSLDARVVEMGFVKDFFYEEMHSIYIDGVRDSSGNEFSDSVDFYFKGSLPEFNYFKLKSPKIMEISIAEILDKNKAIDVSNYLFNNNLDVDSIAFLKDGEECTLNLYFKDSLPLNINLRLDVVNQSDTMDYELGFGFDFCRRNWFQNDLVINEIMADPSPLVGIFPNQLPESEYLELYNRSDYYVNIKDWKLLINGDSVDLGYYSLKPKEYLVLVKNENLEFFEDSTSILGVDISSTALLNSGSYLGLLDVSANVINEISYDGEWYNNTGKEGGGWSLERIDVNSSCNGNVNWKPSENPIGGSPGFQNSIYGEIHDTIPPQVKSVILFGDSLLSIQWDKELDESSKMDSSWVSISPRTRLEYIVLENAKHLKVKFLTKIEAETGYSLKWIIQPQDCFGNSVAMDSIPFAIPFMPLENEVLLNEVLFNPYPGANDFVELYNNSEKVFDLSKMRIGNWNNDLQMIENVSNISNESELFFPHSYLLVTEDVFSVKENYHSPEQAQFLEVMDLPSLADDKGSLCIINSQYQVLDFMEYDEVQHSTFLNDNEGVSLERVSHSLGSNLWYSASSQSGFATPGYENSQTNNFQKQSGIGVKPKLFSPNLDGYNDFMTISLNSENTGFVVDVSIWNSGGKRVRVLEDKGLVGTDTNFIWEGEGDNQNALPSGIYIVLVEGIHPNGETISFKETCVLSR